MALLCCAVLGYTVPLSVRSPCVRVSAPSFGGTGTAAAVIRMEAPPILDEALWESLQAVAAEEAGELGLEIAGVTFVGTKLVVKASGGGIDELQRLSTTLSQAIDAGESSRHRSGPRQCV